MLQLFIIAFESDTSLTVTACDWDKLHATKRQRWTEYNLS